MTDQTPTNVPSPTPETQNRHLDAITRHPEKNDRISWSRKLKKLHDLIDQLLPYEERIFEILLAKQPIADEIALLREEMVKVCVHPKDQLVHNGTHVLCKFCNRRLSLPSLADDE